MRLISKGEWISCPQGHRQFQALREIDSGDIIRSHDFITKSGSHPETETAIGPSCVECGEKFIRSFRSDDFKVKHRPYVEGRGWTT